MTEPLRTVHCWSCRIDVPTENVAMADRCPDKDCPLKAQAVTQIAEKIKEAARG